MQPPAVFAEVRPLPGDVEPRIDPAEAAAMNAELEDASALQIVEAAVRRFGHRLAVTSSFGADSAVMLHLATRVWPQMPVVALDTGFLFPETYAFADSLGRRLNLNLQWFRPVMTAKDFVAEHGQMWTTNPDACCGFNKREPFVRAKRGLDAWLTGIRREQSTTRRNTPVVSIDGEGLVKFCPLATWTAKDVYAYLTEHDLPYHPLREQGYLSIGCTHCTRRVKAGEDPRAGRWAGFDKTECGLHTVNAGGGI